MFSITAIPAFKDNYIWLINQQSSQQVYVVDPGDATAVIDYLSEHNLGLTGIFITHHHSDHTGGISRLQDYFDHSLQVYGPDNERITGLTHPISSQMSQLTVPGIKQAIEIFHLPGHTLGHIAFLIADNLFCGDTLFSGGCGRLFEGTAKQMQSSLTKLAQLEDNTKVYSAHEYTLANLAYAQTVDIDNLALTNYTNHARQLRSNNLPTLPSTIGQEKAINPFLRADNKGIQNRVAKQFKRPVVDTECCFKLLRQWKDNF